MCIMLQGPDGGKEHSNITFLLAVVPDTILWGSVASSSHISSLNLYYSIHEYLNSE